jgi:hypothetical protein
MPLLTTASVPASHGSVAAHSGEAKANSTTGVGDDVEAPCPRRTFDFFATPSTAEAAEVQNADSAGPSSVSRSVPERDEPKLGPDDSLS